MALVINYVISWLYLLNFYMCIHLLNPQKSFLLALCPPPPLPKKSSLAVLLLFYNLYFFGKILQEPSLEWRTEFCSLTAKSSPRLSDNFLCTLYSYAQNNGGNGAFFVIQCRCIFQGTTLEHNQISHCFVSNSILDWSTTPNEEWVSS